MAQQDKKSLKRRREFHFVTAAAAARKAATTHVTTMEVERSVFRAIDGLADLTLIPGPVADGKPTVFALAGYDKMSSLEAASAALRRSVAARANHRTASCLSMTLRAATTTLPPPPSTP